MSDESTIVSEQAKHTPGPLHVFSLYAQHEVRTPTDTLVAVVSRRDDARLFAAAPDLLEAVRRLMPRPLTGNPSHAQLVEFWTYEKTQGRGEADDVLFALAAYAKARGA